jgi:hypothetical protein
MSVEDRLPLVARRIPLSVVVTVPVGNVSTDKLLLLEITKKALMAGIKSGKGGKRVGDISSSIEKVGIMGGGGELSKLWFQG